jgi:hypothetical protein
MYKKKDFDFSKFWGFFAFSNEQFNENKSKLEKWDKYVSLFGGLLWKKSNYKEMLKAFDLHNEEDKKRRIKEEWLNKIILYELNNHECFYINDIDDNVFDLLKEYGATEEQIIKIYKENVNKYESF